MKQKILSALQHELIQRATSSPDVRLLVEFLLARLQVLLEAESALYLKRDINDPTQMILDVADGRLFDYIGQPLALPMEFDELEEGGCAICGPQQGTILLDACYQYAMLLPLGEAGCVVLLSQKTIQFEVDVEASSTLESIGALFGILECHGEEREYSHDAEHSLSEAQRQSELANAAKSEFLTRMSHELRTPLNAILGFTQLFGFDDNLTQLQLDNIKEIERAGYLMLELVSEVLDLAKIESGRIEIAMGEVSLSSVLDECRSLVLNQAVQHNIQLNFNESCKSISVQADQTRLKQVLINLLSNAVKYNRPNGKVTVDCFAISTTCCRIQVIDSGTGIPVNKLDELFQPFNRLGIESAGIEGTGMGLVITKKLVELMGGKIGVESQQGVGTTFWFELQTEQAVAPLSIHSLAERKSMPSPAQLRVLVVEDNPINQDLLRQQLKLLGHTSDVVPHGRAALGIWRQGGYHCILSDCNMPVMDGYEMTEEIRRQEQDTTQHMPIIAITANVGERERQRCHASGMDEVLSKPLDINELGVLLTKLVGHDQVMPNSRVMDDATVLQQKPAIDAQFLANLVGGDVVLQQRVLAKFLETTPVSLDEIDVAIQNKDGNQLKFIAHRLKSSSRSMGGNAMGDCCQQLECAGLNADWPQVALLRKELQGLWQALYHCFSQP